MHFKTVRLTAIRSEPKRTISTGGELGLLQMVLESNIVSYASEDDGLSKMVDCEIPR